MHIFTVLLCVSLMAIQVNALKCRFGTGAHIVTAACPGKPGEFSCVKVTVPEGNFKTGYSCSFKHTDGCSEAPVGKACYCNTDECNK